MLYLKRIVKLMLLCDNILGKRKRNIKHGMIHTREYTSYSCAKSRCTNPNVWNYSRYGGRGIKFLFKSFTEFYEELGNRPNGKSLDRKNNNRHYEPGNVKWSTPSTQQKNRTYLK